MLRQRARQCAVALGLWTGLGVFYGWEIYLFHQHAHEPLSLLPAMWRGLPDFWIYALLTPAVMEFSSRFRFRQDKWMSLAGIHLLAAGAFLFAWSALKVALYPVEDLLTGIALPRNGHLFRTLLVDNAHDALWFYGTIVAVSELLHYQAKCRERERRAATLEAQLARAQLKALKMQLDPHFLFNTLHSISGLIHEDAAAADRTVKRLGSLLRLSCENGNEQEVTLRREMEFLDGYLDIQKTRLGERLRVGVHLAPGTLEALVPNMILQPLVENAVKHGIASRATPGRLDIRAEGRGGALCLEIADDGPGFSRTRNGTAAKGVGIANTRERLQQLYGEAHTFRLDTPPGGGTRVRLEIPLHWQEGGEERGKRHDNKSHHRG